MASARIISSWDYLTRRPWAMINHTANFHEVVGFDAQNVGTFDQANMCVWNVVASDDVYDAMMADPDIFILYGSGTSLDAVSHASGTTLSLEEQSILEGYLRFRDVSATDIAANFTLTGTRSAISAQTITYINTLNPAGAASIPNQFWFSPSDLGIDGTGTQASPYRLSATVVARLADATIGEHDIIWWNGEHRSPNDITLNIPTATKYLDVRGTPTAALLNVNSIVDGDSTSPSWITTSGFVKRISFAYGGGNPNNIWESSSLGATFANLGTLPTMQSVVQSSVVGVSLANPCVITYTGDDVIENGMVVTSDSVGGTVELAGGEFTVANVNTTNKTFELSGVDSSLWTAFTSGGNFAKVPIDLGDYYIHRENNTLTLRPSDASVSDTITGHSYCIPNTSTPFVYDGTEATIQFRDIKMAMSNTSNGFFKWTEDGLFIRNCEFKQASSLLMLLGEAGNIDNQRLLFDNNWVHDTYQGLYINNHAAGHIKYTWETRNRYERININYPKRVSSDGHPIGHQGGESLTLSQYNTIDTAHGSMIVNYVENLNTTDTEFVYTRFNSIKNIAQYNNASSTIHGAMHSGDQQDASRIDNCRIHHNYIQNVTNGAFDAAGIRTKRSYDAVKQGTVVDFNDIVDCDFGVIINNESLVQAKGRYEYNNLIGNGVQIKHSTNHADDTAIEIDNNNYYETEVFDADGSLDTTFTDWQSTCNGKFNASKNESNSTFTLSGTAARVAATINMNAYELQSREAA